jgi:transcription elongation factor Elf1
MRRERCIKCGELQKTRLSTFRCLFCGHVSTVRNECTHAFLQKKELVANALRSAGAL